MRNNSTLSASVSNEKRQTAKVIIYISGTAEVQHWISNNTILFKRGDLSSIYKLVQFSSSVVSDSLQPHGLQHALCNLHIQTLLHLYPVGMTDLCS